MRINADYHTHTKYSDGIGLIEDNVKAAISNGLKEVAITDHAFDHKLHGIKRSQVPEIRKEIERLKSIYDINILLGTEGNLIGSDGSIDITKDDEKLLDIVLVGFHVFGKPKSLKEKFGFFYLNFLGKLFWYTKRRIQINTNAYIRAIESNNIDIITHLGHGMSVDPVAVAKVCKKHNVYLELNGKRIQFKKDVIQKIVDTGVNFIINSDAHTPRGVGKPSLGIRFAEKYNIPEDQIVNVGEFQKLKIKNHKGEENN